jgi:transposase-like protein
MTTTGLISKARMSVEDGVALVARWRASGQRQREFCAEHGLHPERLARWVRQQVRASGDDPSAPGSGFVLGVVSSGVRVRLLSGAVIEIDPTFNARLLRQVVEALC